MKIQVIFSFNYCCFHLDPRTIVVVVVTTTVTATAATTFILIMLDCYLIYAAIS